MATPLIPEVKVSAKALSMGGFGKASLWEGWIYGIHGRQGEGKAQGQEYEKEES